jgi:hypothetical protein
MAPNEMDYTMMGASKIVLREYRIGLCSEVAVRKEQQLDTLPQLILDRVGRSDERFYVSHIDLSRNLRYQQSVICGIGFGGDPPVGSKRSDHANRRYSPARNMLCP